MIVVKKRIEKTAIERKTEIRFGIMIKELRLKYNYTQSILAEKANISTQTLSSIENYGQNVGIGTIKSFADAFGLTLAELFSDYEE